MRKLIGLAVIVAALLALGGSSFATGPSNGSDYTYKDQSTGLFVTVGARCSTTVPGEVDYYGKLAQTKGGTPIVEVQTHDGWDAINTAFAPYSVVLIDRAVNALVAAAVQLSQSGTCG